MDRCKALWWPLGLCVWLCWSGAAEANNLELVPLGDQAALQGRAVVASSRDAGSLWYNPAGLSWMTTSSVNLSGSAFVLRLGDLPEFVELRQGNRSLFEDQDSTTLLSLPSALIYVRRISDGMTGAFGMFVPNSVDIFLRRTDAFNDPVTGTTEWGFQAISQAQDYRFGAGMGVRVTDALRLGGTIFATYRRDKTILQLWSFTQRGTSEESSDVLQFERFGDDFGGQAVLGAQLKVHPQLQFGLAVRSPVLRIFRKIESNRFGVSVRSEASNVFLDNLIDEEGHTFDVLEGGAVRAGLEWKIQGVSINLEGEYRTASEALRDVYNVRLGVGFEPVPDVLVGAGLFTDAAQPKTLDEGDFAADYFGSSLGVRFGELASATGDIRFHTTVALNHAFGFGKIRQVRFDPNADEPIAIGPKIIDTTSHDVGLYVSSGVEF